MDQAQFAALAVTDTPPAPDRPDVPAAWDVVIKRTRDQRNRYADAGPVDAYDALIAAMEARDKLGAERYGRRLKPWNGQDPLVEALQECLDMIVYLQCEQMERPSLFTEQLIGQATHVALLMTRRYLRTRGGQSEV